jgi:hypothetical protein
LQKLQIKWLLAIKNQANKIILTSNMLMLEVN